MGRSKDGLPDETPYVPHADTLKPRDFNDKYIIKDSGEREQFSTGMHRDTEKGKTDWTLIYDGPMLRRWAEHLTKGAVKYKPRNWMLATTEEELSRHRRSLGRHYHQYMDGEVDEDHAAAIFFNVNGMEYVKERLAHGPDPVPQVQRG